MSNIVDKVKRKVKSVRRRARSRVSSLRERIGMGGEGNNVLGSIRERIQGIRGGKFGGTGTPEQRRQTKPDVRKSERRGM